MARRPKGPAYTFSMLALVLIVLIGVFALTARTPPPPSIAEFAPQAVDSITDAPTDQSSSGGTGKGECLTGGAQCEGEGSGSPIETPPPPIQVARVRKCVGDPPRQIEDPQSPPCVPYWEGDNGGATTKGVTRDEIRIATRQVNQPTYDDLAAFFNRRFELYGRKIRFYPNDNGVYDKAGSHAAATTADEELKVFASTSWWGGNSNEYTEELARRKVMSVWTYPIAESAYLQRHSPYMWQYPMAVDQIFANVGEWVCKRLAGRNAIYAGDPTFRTRQREFGVVVQYGSTDTAVSVGPLLQQLSTCGVSPKNVIVQNAETDPADSYQSAVLRMRQDGVTSVICLCFLSFNTLLTGAATNQGYFPEWLISTYFQQETNEAMRTYGMTADQRAHVLGLTFVPRQLKPESHPWYWARKEANPACDCGTTGAVDTFIWQYWHYQEALLLASGIQQAGPHLTPETFAKGLWKTRFPNPDHPNMEGRVGFAQGTHAMTLDGAELFWSESARSPYPNQGTGSFCYLDGGKRYSLGNWPSGEGGFFAAPCDSGV